MIEVQNLTKCYGRFVALDEVSFSARQGEIVGFLGPNGAGKTTTMRILTGYMPPTEGTARVAGCDIFEDSLEMRRHVGYLPETVRLYRDMTVQGYLRFVAQLRSVDRSSERVAEVLELVGMTDRARSLIRNLSKGMQQRVGLAQAIVHNPEVLILDEPTIGLDPHQVQDLRLLIRDLGQTHTVMLSTHILSEAEQICDRVIILDRGRIVAEDTPDQLRENLNRGGRLFLRVGEHAAPQEVLRVVQAVPGVEKVEAHREGYMVSVRGSIDVRPALAAAVVGHSLELLELRPWATTLEEIFLDLTTRLGQEPGRRRGRSHA
ncbi:MAG TPA: ABC transporter ATP-binding protein [Aggregatilineaceae bacterium]|nr:ABC transporter ATP-binding protein [Aggregatilineaceae bacterium]